MDPSALNSYQWSWKFTGTEQIPAYTALNRELDIELLVSKEVHPENPSEAWHMLAMHGSNFIASSEAHGYSHLQAAQERAEWHALNYWQRITKEAP